VSLRTAKRKKAQASWKKVREKLSVLRALKEKHAGQIDDLDSDIQDLDSEILKLQNPDSGVSDERPEESDSDSASADSLINQFLMTGKYEDL
jgi:peptidoglycan hydrolase CwlO-like protein